MLQEPSPTISVVQNSLSNTLFKDGDFVFVRVVNHNSDGSYTASFAGNRFIVRSLIPLSIGSSFKAQLKLENSVLKLIPVFENQAVSAFSQTDAGFLSRIGLLPDDISQRVIQFFQQFNIKINLHRAQKARSLSQVFPGQEKDAAEAVLFLADKGIDATEQLVSLILRNTRSNTNPHEEDTDFLSYINHKKGSNHHWIILPFENNGASTDTSDSGSSLQGVAKILINIELKKMEKMAIECNTAVKKFFFVLQLCSISNKKQKKVLSYCTAPGLSIEEMKLYSEHLTRLFDNHMVDDVHYEQGLVEDGIFCRNLDLSFFQGSV
ncbi:MAG TPA: hypothetical protein PLG87_02535 [Treponemataceae bacterium]|nr:hypothetical protein [Treponemataceae bacterium]